MTGAAAIESAAREVLNTIVDPCSVRAGAPAGLVDMGLVHGVAASPGPGGWQLTAVLGVTDPTCLMAAVFLGEAQRRLTSINGVVAVVCTLDHKTIWTPERLTPGYAARLAGARASRLEPA